MEAELDSPKEGEVENSYMQMMSPDTKLPLSNPVEEMNIPEEDG